MIDKEKSDREVLNDLHHKLQSLLDNPTSVSEVEDWSEHERKVLKDMVSTVVFLKRLGRLGLYILVTGGIIAANIQNIKDFFA